MARRKSGRGIQSMKLIAIKEECYAISGIGSTRELKKKYKTLCQKLDFRKRSSWEYILKNLRENGSWSGVNISDLEKLANQEKNTEKYTKRLLIFSPERIEMDRDAENDD
jgi:hypothetical protein